MPLSVIGQINLGDLEGYTAAHVLPPSGVLSFFYHPEQSNWGFDPNDRGSARVFRFPESSRLEPTDLPTELPEHGRFDAGAVSFREVVSLPPYQALAIEALGFSDEDADKYFNAWVIWNQLQGDGPAHQLLGHPNPIQKEMQLECQLVTNGIYCSGSEAFSDPRWRP